MVTKLVGLLQSRYNRVAQWANPKGVARLILAAVLIYVFAVSFGSNFSHKSAGEFLPQFLFSVLVLLASIAILWCANWGKKAK